MSLTGTIKALTFFFSLLTLISLLPGFKIGSWEVEALRNFLGYLFFWHVFACFFLPFAKPAYRRFFILTYLLQLLLVIYIGSFIYPFYFSTLPENTAACKQEVRVLFSNVKMDNEDSVRLKKVILETKPDIVGLAEMNTRWGDELGLKYLYPNSYENFREDHFGIALYSKFPFSETGVSDFGENIPPAAYKLIKINEISKLRTVLLHAIPPLHYEMLYTNRMLYRRIATKLRFVEEAVLVMGDFNATPFSDYYTNFINWTGTQSIFEGRGLRATWNANWPVLRLTLDHILFKNMFSSSAEILGNVGSDHYPVLATFSLPAENCS